MPAVFSVSRWNGFGCTFSNVLSTVIVLRAWPVDGKPFGICTSGLTRQLRLWMHALICCFCTALDLLQCQMCRGEGCSVKFQLLWYNSGECLRCLWQPANKHCRQAANDSFGWNWEEDVDYVLVLCCKVITCQLVVTAAQHQHVGCCL